METSSAGPYMGNILNEDDSFRLISLEPGHSDDPLLIRLLNTTLHNTESYEAISYVWGDASKSGSVQILDNEEDIEVRIDITHNCQAALKSLRRVDSPRVLWIDSICINQSSSAEKTHQLNLMAHIYKNASQVLVYLGEGTAVSDTAMKFIRELDEPSDYGNRNTMDETQSDKQDERTAVNHLLESPWFYRVWVLQEITFAQKATVICGSQQVDWDSFKEFHHWNVSERWVKRPPYSVSYSALLKTLKDTRFCGATDPRDRLYAILPLIDREHDEMVSKMAEFDWGFDEKETQEIHLRQQRLAIQPNYNHSVTQVYTNLAIELLRSIGLDLLTFVVGEPLTNDLPSWVPDWTTSSPYWVAKAPKVPRQKPFAGFPEGPLNLIWGWKNVHPHLISTWAISEYGSSSDKTSTQLHIRAVRIGTITKAGDICDIGKDYFPISQWASLMPDESYLEKVDESNPYYHDSYLSPFAMTLALGDIVYPRAVRDVIKYVRRYNGENLEQKENEWPAFGIPSQDEKERIPLSERFSYGPSYEKQALWILKHSDGKRMVVMDDGSIGLAPDRAEVGDVVFVVQGASVPFVLRALGRDSEVSEDSVEKCYSLVGEAVVLGVMDGEIWELVDNGKKVVEKVIIR
ncbi:heterokaryon incompatibility protein-domain-containing protein [Fusarium tricinctum]|uniref:Heterokaryon incompatibility protein-domain-containing protein n=1 Tax=Fusarium tricinctum TaxID=61284 RepID=A0A8K0S3V5_9HYPO|nr:heterokaryon incompatibility protein-domain-containing protein [Fusarium tricinctum]